MRLPGVRFLRDQQAVKAFERQDPAFRDLVFYSEGAGDWPHLGPIIRTLLDEHDVKISYLTSDATDPGLAIGDNERFRTFNIGSGTARTILFARVECRRFVMTLPDLGNMWLKRSVHPVGYVYVFHSMNSTHTSYREGAFDKYDAILCVGRHHVEEIRRTEEVYGLRPKELVEHGSVKLDTVLEEVALHHEVKRGASPTVLVAPTWGESSLIEQPIGRETIAILLRAGYRTVLRLHPMTVRRLPRLVADLSRSFGHDQRFVLEEDMSSTSSWLQSDVMISDWSGAAIEYGFALDRPVIYVDTPPKLMNPAWERIGLPSFEDLVRGEIGHVVAPTQLDDLPAIVDSLNSRPDVGGANARTAASKWVFNLGASARVAADYLANSAAAGRA